MDAMVIAILGVPARCGGCGTFPFHAPQAPFRLDDMFVCVKCHGKSAYGQLLDSIGKEAMRQAKQALKFLRERSTMRKALEAHGPRRWTGRSV